MKIRTVLPLTLAALAATWGVVHGASGGAEPARPADVVRMSDVRWEQLNPARGDSSPKAGTLWGDRTGAGPGGFLLKPADGFSSPPHIHNIPYRGVVISGLIHNDDPGAEAMYMPAGSFWTQPAGEVHITAAKGNDSLAYIEIENDFGVLPAAKAFFTRERAVNVDLTNLVWVDGSDLAWVETGDASAPGAEPQVAFLWGRPGGSALNGTLVKLPAGSGAGIRNGAGTLRAIVIQGRVSVGDATDLEPGSYFGAQSRSLHEVACAPAGACILYVRTTERYELVSSK